jgi:hypothetical protein
MNSQRKPGYSVAVKGGAAAKMMGQLREFMGNRRQEQIRRALANFDPHRRSGSGARLTRQQVLEIYERVNSNETQMSIANDFNIHRSTVADIKTGKSWAWLTGASLRKEPES